MASIHKLPADVVNRIAAGEVVQRPSAALKELLENAIDADCSRIQVVAAEGGLEVLQVSDDGTGIHKEDLPLLCERYATSKLQSFEDLHRVTSFGFRGEALASISYVSRVTVTTRRRPSVSSAEPPGSAAACQVAWRAQYLNGSLTSDPQPCAGNAGTTIRAEKLFYNALVRRNSLRPSEEWSRIVDVVSRYALAYPKVGFTCQRDLSYGGGGDAAVGGASTQGGGGGVSFPVNSTTRQNIRLSHGSSLASHLRLVYAYETGGLGDAEEAVEHPEVPVKAEAGASWQQPATEGGQSSSAQEARVFAQMEQRARRVRAATGLAGEGRFTLVGYTSDPTLAQRKPYLCLFINQRLVESAAIRKAIDGVYGGVLTGGNRPFTVLLLTVPTDRIDVNVHPTKKEVYLLDEELIVSRVAEVCRGAVLEAAAARQMDMLKMRHTTAVALKQLPMADGTGGAESAGQDGSGSSSQHILEKLRDQHRRGVPMASPLTSSSAAASSAPAAAGGAPAVVVAPCTVVRVEPQRGALDRYFSPRLATADSATERSDGAPSQLGSAPLVNAPEQPRASAARRGETPSVLVDADGAAARVSASAAESAVMVSDGAPPVSYAVPSWEAVLASIPRPQHAAAVSGIVSVKTEPCDPLPTAAPSDETTREAAQEEHSATAPSTLVKAERLVATDVPFAAGDPPVLSAMGVKAEAGPVVKREGGVGGATSYQALHRDATNHYVNDDEEGEDDEDAMREFKRHRRDVHERVEVLRRAAPESQWAAEGTQSDGHGAVHTRVPSDARSSAGGKGHETQELSPQGAGAAAESPSTDGCWPHNETREEARGKAVEEETESLKLTRLGAVVQAADLLRAEAAAAERRAATFAHVISASDASDAEDDERGIGSAGRSVLLCDGADAGTAAGLVSVAEVAAPAILSSVSVVVDQILEGSSPSAVSLISQLTYVGAVDGRAFLAQVGTTLVWCDTMRLVRHAVFQRVFLRWGQPSLPAPPVLEFDVPLPVADLLCSALAHDAPHLQPSPSSLLALLEACGHDAARGPQPATAGRQPPLVSDSFPSADALQRMGGLSARAWRERLFDAARPSSDSCETGGAPASSVALPPPKAATRRYVRRLVRRLCRWRGLLKEYFAIDITDDGLLRSVPYGLSRHWPPLLRALPLTLWRIAEEVPYPAGPTAAPQDGASGPAHETPGHTSAPLSSSTTPAATQSAVEAEADGVAQEVACFTAIARHLADTLYGLQPPPPPPPASVEESSAEGRGEEKREELWWAELVQHGLFPCLKNAQLFRLPDVCLRDGTVQSMVSVESLYKVFERC